MRFVLITISALTLGTGSPTTNAGPASQPATTRPIARIAAGDQLDIVLGELIGEQSERTLVVDQQGKVKLPLLESIRIAGMTVAEAEQWIANAYIREKILTHPVVEIRTPANPSTRPQP